MANVTYDGPVFSYIRYSNIVQKKGDSERRQLEAAQKWCAQRGLHLDTRLKLKDDGVSGFHQKNAEHGALGKFLESVKSGDVPVGSTLLIENLDRLSRDQILRSLGLFTLIITSGIRIVTLMDGQEFTSENVNDNPYNLMLSIGVLHRGHEESKTKSKRIREAFAARRANLSERKWATNYPPWLALSDDKKSFRVLETKANVVRDLFKDYDRGVGVFTIARQRQAKKVGRPSDDVPVWQTSTVQYYLTSRAVIGEFQPKKRDGSRRVPVGEPIRDYFPAIVTDSLFARVNQKLREKRKVRGRRSPDFVNLFRGLLRCPYCGSSILLRRQVTKNGRHRAIYVCDSALRHQTCLAFGWDCEEFEACFLEYAHSVHQEYAKAQLPRPEPNELPSVSARLEEKKMEEDRMLHLYRQNLVHPEKIGKILSEIQADISSLENEKRCLENSSRGVTEKQFKFDIKQFITADLTNLEKREQLAEILPRLFSRIDVYFAGLPSRQKWLIRERNKLLKNGLKGNQIYFQLAKRVSFQQEQFFIGLMHELGAKPYPDFLTDPDFVDLYGKGAKNEFSRILHQLNANGDF